jgi:glycosyltransferase involved in cell wall biosynthesis
MAAAVAVSVIVPTRNRAHFLDDCLRTLSAQRCDAAFEIVVVDNASEDATPALIEVWHNQDARIRGVREVRLGRSAAMNTGIQDARGWLLLFADDDLLIEPGWIDGYLGLFTDRGGDLMVAGGKILPVPSDLSPWPDWLSAEALVDIQAVDWGARRTLEPLEYVWGGNMAVPRHVFDAVGLWDESIGRRGEARGTYEDTEFQDRVRAAGGAVWFCPESAVRHRVDARRVTRRSVLANAFARGRNDRFRETLAPGGAPPPRATAGLEHAPALAWTLMTWTACAAVLRLTAGRKAVEAARRAAWKAGWNTEALRAASGRPMGRSLAALSLVASRVAVRLSPGG